MTDFEYLDSVLWICGLLFVVVPIWWWIKNVSIFGREILKSVPATHRFVLSSERGLFYVICQGLFVASCVLVVSRFFVPDFLGSVPQGAFALVGCIAAGFALYLVQPPIILFLATSCPESKELVLRLGLSIGPWKIVYLLKPDADLTVKTLLFGEETDKWSLRQRAGQGLASWESVVRQLMETTPIIVIDARQETDQMYTEAKHLLSSRRLAWKTIVITRHDGSHPVLTSAAKQSPEMGKLWLSERPLDKEAAELMTETGDVMMRETTVDRLAKVVENQAYLVATGQSSLPG